MIPNAFPRLPVILCILTGTLLLGGGCSDEDPAGPTGGEPDKEGYVSALTRETDPGVSADDLALLTAGGRRFAVDLYRRLADEPHGNLLISPLSIRMALAMTYGGARGETAAQMTSALDFGLEGDDLHRAWNALDQILAGRNLPATDDEGAVDLYLANAVWGQDGYPFFMDYLDLLALNYGAGFNALDFRGGPEACRLTINNRVADRTRQKIEDLLPADSVDPDTRLVLTNALYFKSPWEVAFNEDDTAERTFYRDGGEPILVPTMRQMKYQTYYAEAGCEAVGVLLRNPDLVFVVILPVGGDLAGLEDDLSADLLGRILEGLADRQVDLDLPCFSFTCATVLNSTLKTMGMPLAFGEAADFTGITRHERLAITGVFHKTFMGVDEKGVEAAAATAVTMGPTAIPDPVIVRVDRPFLVMIADRPTGAVLFLGRVTDPT